MSFCTNTDKLNIKPHFISQRNYPKDENSFPFIFWRFSFCARVCLISLWEKQFNASRGVNFGLKINRHFLTLFSAAERRSKRKRRFYERKIFAPTWRNSFELFQQDFSTSRELNFWVRLASRERLTSIFAEKYARVNSTSREILY